MVFNTGDIVRVYSPYGSADKNTYAYQITEIREQGRVFNGNIALTLYELFFNEQGQGTKKTGVQIPVYNVIGYYSSFGTVSAISCASVDQSVGPPAPINARNRFSTLNDSSATRDSPVRVLLTWINVFGPHNYVVKMYLNGVYQLNLDAFMNIGDPNLSYGWFSGYISLWGASEGDWRADLVENGVTVASSSFSIKRIKIDIGIQNTGTAWDFYVACSLRNAENIDFSSSIHLEKNSSGTVTFYRAFSDDTYGSYDIEGVLWKEASQQTKLDTGLVTDVITLEQLFPSPAPPSTPLPPLPSSTMSINSSPSGADIYIDGVFKGSTPSGAFTINPGTYAIEIRKTDYVTSSMQISILAGEYQTYNFTLTLESGGTTPTDTFTITPRQPHEGQQLQKEYGILQLPYVIDVNVAHLQNTDVTVYIGGTIIEFDNIVRDLPVQTIRFSPFYGQSGFVVFNQTYFFQAKGAAKFKASVWDKFPRPGEVTEANRIADTGWINFSVV